MAPEMRNPTPCGRGARESDHKLPGLIACEIIPHLSDIQAARLAARFKISLPHALVVAELALSPTKRRA